MSGESARKLRLHPIPDDEAVDKSKHTGRFVRTFKVWLWVLTVGLLVGAGSQGYFHVMRFYRAESRITLKGPDASRDSSRFRKHLAGLQTASLSLRSIGREPVSIHELMRDGQVAIFPIDQQTIGLAVTGKNRDEVSRMADDLAVRYVALATGNQTPPAPKTADQQEKLLGHYKQLQQQHEQLKLEIHNLVQSLPPEKIDPALEAVTRKIQTCVGQSQAQVDRLDKINRQIDALRDELLHPTLKRDPRRWEPFKNSDRWYMGDLNVLKVRHGEYLSILQTNLKGLTEALDQLHTLLKSLSTTITGQLKVQLPEDLSDDLLEMNLAVDKYEGQVIHFRQRWEVYQSKLIDLLANPTQADFDNTGTLLSQARQDLLGRCSRMPIHLEGLFNQVRQGPSSHSGQPGKLSSLTARNVAGSALSQNLELAQDAWRRVSFFLNRLFPDANVRLLTLGRTCRSLRSRLNYHEKQLMQTFDREQLAIQRRETQNQLFELQNGFHATSEKLMRLYREFSGDQKQLLDLGRRGPALQRIKDALADNENRMTTMEKELSWQTPSSLSERLETRPAVVSAYSYAGINPRNEPACSILLALVAMAVTMGILRQKALARH